MVYHLLPISPLFHKIILLPLRNKKTQNSLDKSPSNYLQSKFTKELLWIDTSITFPSDIL